MAKNSVIISHPTGNANVRYMALALVQHKLLSAFYTCIAVFKGSIIAKFAIGPFKEFLKRSFAPELQRYTHTHPFKELGRMAALKLGKRDWVKQEQGKFSVDAIYRDLDMHVSKKLTNQKAIYAYEDGALQSFKVAKSKGIVCLYDLPIGYWRSMRKLLETEKVNRPEWAVTLTGFNDSEAKLQRKDSELSLADHIFVASSFTKKTLEMYPGKLTNIEVIPYGFPPVYKNKQYAQADGSTPLKVLFVGGLSQRKGIANVFEAVEYLGSDKIELTVVGLKSAEDCKPLNEGLEKCNYIPSLPHSEILELMQTQDVFVFPSLFEGFGLVITESMSQGLPVIATDRTIAPDIIEHGRNGWIIEPGSTPSLISCLQTILDDRSQLKKCGEAAMQTAMNRPWEKYGLDMANAINAILLKDNAVKN
jgi:glycosyltransferase involved in cell wall biosynthesis